MAKKTRTPLEKSLVGPAGEHFVLYRLYRQGLLASLAPPGTPVVDILVLDLDGETVKATIQVKTRVGGPGGGWILGKKHESLIDRRMFYALVDLGGEHPVTYVVPSSVVAGHISEGHQAWLDRPGVHGQPHRDSAVRQLSPLNPFPGWLDQYREAWELITSEGST